MKDGKGVGGLIRKAQGFAMLILIGIAQCMTAQAADRHPIRIAYQLDPNIGFYLAQDAKLFEKAQLQPEYIKFLAAPPMFAALQSASVDVADMGLAPFIIGRTQGIAIEAVMIAVDVSGTNALIVQKNSNVQSAKDLKGLRIGAQRGTTPVYGLEQYLRRAGMSLQDVKFIDLSAPNIIPAFKREEIDATWVWSPWQNMLTEMGGKRITTNKDVGAYAPQVWAVRSEWARKNPEALQEFIKVIGMSLQQAAANQGNSTRILATALNVEPAMAAEMLKASDSPTLEVQGSATYPLSVTAGYPGATAGLSLAIKRAAEFLQSVGIIKTSVNADELINPAPLKRHLGIK